MSYPSPLLIESDAPYTTLGAVELNSIAQGVETLDTLVKEAPVRILLAQPSSPGKYLIIVTGEVDEVRRALGHGLEVSGDARVDDVLLPAAHIGLRTALSARGTGTILDGADPLPAIGVLETYSAPSLLGAVDTALKTGETHLEEIHLLSGIGGKATALLAGDVESVRVAVDAGAAFAARRDLLARRVLIPRPDPSIVPFLFGRRRSPANE